MTVVSDNFDRADSTNLGASWTEVIGDWAIVSNQCECNDDDGATGYYARYETDVGGSDMYTEAVDNATQTNASSNGGVAVRMRAAANTSYQFATNLNDSHAFWRIVAGTETQITTLSSPLAAGDTIRIEAAGRTLRAKINGALVGLTQDVNITDGQRGGINGYNNTSTDVVRFDNFEAGLLTDDLVAPYVADWSAQTARSTGTAMTPTVPAQVAAGDLVCVLGTVRSVTDTISAPAGEGFSQVQLASGNSLRSYLFAKVWGLGGQTDDTTPTFTRTGTTGAFVTAFIVRNPKHATNPWTAVTDAIVASGQQSNAAAALATAPSVTHTGSNRTVVRCFSSADDNALGTPSEGVLVFGGAAYDATDIAQACTIREDFTISGSTGTATVTETTLGNDANNGITAVLAIPSPSTPATVTPAVIAASAAVAQTASNVVAGPAAVSAVTSLPRSSDNIQAGPTAVAATATLSQATPTAVTLVQPAAAATAAALPQPTPSGTAVATAAATAAPVSFATPTLDATTLVQPATLTAVVALPTASTLTGATVMPSAVVTVVAAAAAALDAHTVTQPSTLAAVASIPSATHSGAATAQPAVLTGSASLPSVEVLVSAGPAAVPAVASLPAATILAGGNITVTPDQVAAIVTLPTGTPAGSAIASPALAASVVDLPAAGLSVSAGASVLAAVAALPAVTAIAGGNVTVTPDPVAAAAAVLAASLNISIGPTLVVATSSLPPLVVDTGSAATATPTPITAVAALPQAAPTIGPVVSPAAIAVVVALGAVMAGGPVGVVHPVVLISRVVPLVAMSTSTRSPLTSSVETTVHMEVTAE